MLDAAARGRFSEESEEMTRSSKRVLLLSLYGSLLSAAGNLLHPW
jgi:hypothetical protein